jgi:cullin-associated NEDD8-dissociated protein 1
VLCLCSVSCCVCPIDSNNHMDLSFWAFEQLAHPSYGVMPIEYRPVACDSGAPLL